MRKLLNIIIFLATIAQLLTAQNKIFPKSPSAWVNDYAGILTSEEANRLNTKLGNYEDTTSTQIFIVTLDETQGAEISALAAEIGQTWGVGQKGKENGIVILIYPNERKIFIATGYGLEEYIPDAIANRIIDKEITPDFKNRKYYTGLDKATDVIMGLLSGKFTADQYRKKGGNDETPFAGIFFLIILFYIIFRSRSGRYTSMGRNVPFWIALGMLSGSRHTHSGSFGGFSSGSGGFGGFSGGGGGSFGGGGAGGSW
jgi:uncharacterized protein